VTKKPPPTTTTKRPAGAGKKAAADEKRPWLRDLARQMPQLPPAPKRLSTAHLLDKAQVCAIANVSFPTIWQCVFPRSRVVGGKSMWLSNEVDDWLRSLPVRRLKGDAPTEAA
jgi:predicted DNA-binding transcriptional regulator AlpA